GSAADFLFRYLELHGVSGFEPQYFVINFIPCRDTSPQGQREIVNRFLSSQPAAKPFSRSKGKLINDPLATIIVNGRVVGVWEWSEDGDDIDLLLFDSIAKSAERAIHKRASELAGFIRSNLGEVRLQGVDYGPHQTTGIHDLKAFWGKGAQADSRV